MSRSLLNSILKVFLTVTLALAGILHLGLVNGAETVQTSCSIALYPQTASVGMTVTVHSTVQPAPPTVTDKFSLNVVIVRPDGSSETRGPFASYADNATLFSYIPATVGTYMFMLRNFQQFFASGNVTYLSSNSEPAMLTMQPQLSPTPSPTPLPTGQGGLITFLTSDTTWTKAGSPYTFAGPIAVVAGVTLTISAGVTVNLGGNFLFVNGTLRALGSATDKIQIIAGSVTLDNTRQTGSDSIIENAIINSSISSGRPLTIRSSTINGEVSVGAGSKLADSVISGEFKAGNSTTITGSTISGTVSIGDFAKVSHSTITGDVTLGSSAIFSDNTVKGGERYIFPMAGSAYSTALTVSNSSVITGNDISGGIVATSSKISDNVVSGGGPFTDWGGRGTDSTSAIIVSGNSTITNNTVFSSNGGFGILIKAGYTRVYGNSIRNGIRVAGDALIEGNLISNSGSAGIRVGQIFVPAFNEVDYGHGNSIIRNNTITGNSVGISSDKAGGTAMIANNLISNNTYGISLSSEASVLNNTINNCTDAITLKGTTPTMKYNNIANYASNSMVLSSISRVVDATYNWWGTTDVQSINLTIRDFKYDLNLGTVNFVPLLTAPNAEAPAQPIPLTTPSLPTSSVPSSTPMPTSAPGQQQAETSSSTSADAPASTNASASNPTQPSTNESQSPQPAQTSEPIVAAEELGSPPPWSSPDWKPASSQETQNVPSTPTLLTIVVIAIAMAVIAAVAYLLGRKTGRASARHS
ncbi:MAG: right-handed parallel beta-helix repeat-containing protein [Candidatus Bathyarchaeia archaeon]